MTGYRVEYATTSRAKCQGPKPCKGTAIAKGDMRFGTWVVMNEHGSFKWRHWSCVTPSVLRNVMGTLEEKVEELDGFEDLRPEDQEKVKYAFTHIESVATAPAGSQEVKDDPNPSEPAKKVSKKRKKAKQAYPPEEPLKSGEESDKETKKVVKKNRKNKKDEA